LKPITQSLPKILGASWVADAIACTDKAKFLGDNARAIARLATNVERCGAGPQEATKAAESHLIAFRALCCRCSAAPSDFRPWTRAEKMRAIAAQNDARPKEIFNWLGCDTSTEKADRMRIYKASTTEEVGRRWTRSAEPMPLYLSACLQFWTTSPTESIPPLCFLTDSAISAIFHCDTAGEEAIRQAIHRAGLHRPQDAALALRAAGTGEGASGHFARQIRGRKASQKY
jgi:hypothetical protein